MEPLIANSKSNNCGTTISSNCVPYQGTPLPCQPSCANQTVSDVIYKLGQEYCYLNGLLDLSTLDLSCCYTPCPSCDQPTKLVDVLQIMMTCICNQATQIAALQAQQANLNAGVSTR